MPVGASTVWVSYRRPLASFDQTIVPPRSAAPMVRSNCDLAGSTAVATRSSCGCVLSRVNHAICRPSGDTAKYCSSKDPSRAPDSRRMVVVRPAPGSVSTKPKSSLYDEDDALDVGVTFGLAVGLGGTSIGTLVSRGVGDGLRSAAVC